MRKFADRVLNYGIAGSQSAHDQRRIKAANLLNLVIIGSLLIGYTNYFVLKSDFATGPVTTFLCLALFSLYLSRINLTQWAFALFTFNANLSIFFINEYYPLETGAYLYYFPVIVSVVLLVNPSFRDKFSILHFSICVLFIVASFVVDVPEWKIKHLTPETAQILFVYDLVISLGITALIGFMLTRLILKQNQEIVLRNLDLMTTREHVDNSLKEKEVLLAELHHRVKNNLAIISGLLSLQEAAVKNPEAIQIIGDTRHRIMSMAMVHKMLYKNQNLESIDIGQYSAALISNLFRSAQLSDRVSITERYDAIMLPVDKSIPLGLILNEIVTNSIKYAYPNADGTNGSFFISIKSIAQGVEVEVLDSGKGFPLDMNKHESSASLGIYLIKSLSEQIDGTVRFSNAPGARIILNFAHN